MSHEVYGALRHFGVWTTSYLLKLILSHEYSYSLLLNPMKRLMIPQSGKFSKVLSAERSLACNHASLSQHTRSYSLKEQTYVSLVIICVFLQ